MSFSSASVSSRSSSGKVRHFYTELESVGNISWKLLKRNAYMFLKNINCSSKMSWKKQLHFKSKRGVSHTTSVGRYFGNDFKSTGQMKVDGMDQRWNLTSGANCSSRRCSAACFGPFGVHWYLLEVTHFRKFHIVGLTVRDTKLTSVNNWGLNLTGQTKSDPRHYDKSIPS